MKNTHRIKLMLSSLIVLLVLLTGCSTGAQTTGSFAQLPSGMAYADGIQIYFIHTEASDPDIAEKLTNMMDSPVLYVPSLAQVPEESRAKVFVFENGMAGKGPLGFQADVFDNPPASQGYSPLREIVLVKWVEGVQPAELKSADEISLAIAEGKLTAIPSGVIVNMPFVVWDGGKR